MRLLAERIWSQSPTALARGARPPLRAFCPSVRPLGVPTKVRQQRTQSLPSRWLCLVWDDWVGQEEPGGHAG